LLPCEYTFPHTLFQGEVLELVKRVRPRGNVETWLGQLEDGIAATLKVRLKDVLGQYSSAARPALLARFPAQVLLVATQITWTRAITECLSGPRLRRRKDLQAMLQSWVQGLQELVAASAVPSMSRTTALAVASLITTDVHHRDVIANLVDTKTIRTDDYEWVKNLRFEWNSEEDVCVVHQGFISLPYSYEYVGCGSRLVVTPLTDRCFTTMMTALSLNLGGAAIGPAGTGKTVSIKDLAKALGKLCVVFNCSADVESKMVGRLFSGLAQTGAWVCLDEFNRIDVEVLSILAQQLRTIKSAKDARLAAFLFEGREITLVPSCGCFATMNPGYAGRAELPDNLKSLFRPITMTSPDKTLIAEVLLYSQGRPTASELAPRLAAVYSIAEEQLSKQAHYDFGLRAVRSAVHLAGRYRALNGDDPQDWSVVRAIETLVLPTLVGEDITMFTQIVRSVFGPIPTELSAQPSAALFRAAMAESATSLGLQAGPTQLGKAEQLLGTLQCRMGTVVMGQSATGKSALISMLGHCLTAIASASALADAEAAAVGDVTPSQGTRAHSAATSPGRASNVASGAERPSVTVHTRSTVSTPVDEPDTPTGAPLIASTSAHEAYARAILQASAVHINAVASNVSVAASATNVAGVSVTTITGVRRVSIARINPKSITLHQLFGRFNPQTFEWTDGLLPCVLRQHIAQVSATVGPATSELWTVFDGPVDSLWVENLNTVLDETKSLCLANGERVRVPDTVRIIFEVSDLAGASPATITRCGIVHVDSTVLDWRSIFNAWLARTLPTLPVTSPPATAELRSYLTSLAEAFVPKGLDFAKRRECYVALMAPNGLVLSLCKFLSALLAADAGYLPRIDGASAPVKLLVSRLFLFAFTWTFGGAVADGQPRLEFDAFLRDLVVSSAITGLSVPSALDVYSYFVEPGSGTMQPWDTSPARRKVHALSPAMVVPTPHVLALQYVMSLMARAGMPVLLVGAIGVGKSAVIQELVAGLVGGMADNSRWVSSSLQLTAFSSASRVTEWVEQNWIRRRSDNQGQWLALVEDLHVPRTDAAGAQVRSRWGDC
jgi:dynein heavy chain, axonemal